MKIILDVNRDSHNTDTEGVKLEVVGDSDEDILELTITDTGRVITVCLSEMLACVKLLLER